MKRFVIALVIGFGASTSFAESSPKKLSLDDAIELGIQNATLVLKSKTQREITGADLLAAYGRFLPNLALTANYGDSTGTSFSPAGPGLINATYRQASYQLSSAINLFDGFGDIAAVHAANNRDAASALTLDRAKQQIAIDVAQSFLQVYLDEQVVSIDEQNLKVSQDRQKLISAKRAVGSSSDADLYRQEAETARDESTLIDSKQRAHIDFLKLLQRIRIDARENYVIDQPQISAASQVILPSERTLIDDALKDRKDYSAQKNVTRAAESDVVTAQRTYWPTLDLVGAFGGVARSYSDLTVGGQSIAPPSQSPLFDQLGPQNQFSVGLNLNWAIFDRFLTTDTAARAQAVSENARVDLDDLSKQVIVDVRQGYSDYLAAAEKVRTTSVQEKASQAAFNVINGRYRVGASSFLDLSAAQGDLVQAQSEHAQALVNLQLRTQALLFYTGRDPRGRL